MILQIEFYTWTRHAAVRDLVADVLRRCRQHRAASTTAPLTPTEFKAYQLWVAGAFRHDTLAAGWWLDKDWPIVRRGDGRWWAFDRHARRLHHVRMLKNLSANVTYQQLA